MVELGIDGGITSGACEVTSRNKAHQLAFPHIIETKVDLDRGDRF